MEQNTSSQNETENTSEEKAEDIYEATPYFEREEAICNTSCIKKKETILNTSCSEKEAESTNFDKPDISGNDLLNKVMSNRLSHNKSYCRSWFQSSTVEYIWDIDRVITHLQITKELTSSKFPETGQYQIKITMDVDKNNMLNSKVKFYLLTKKEFFGICDISFIDSYAMDCQKNCWDSYAGLMTDMTLLCEISLGLFDKDILCKDKIVIHFEFEILHQFQARNIDMNVTPTNTICKNFNYEHTRMTNMMTKNKAKSIMFIIDKDRYNISILLLRSINSTYFNNICDMFENNESDHIKFPYEVKIDDKNTSMAFKRMLIFISSGTLSTSYDYDTVRNLLIVAHKYDVETLKLTCEQYLVRRINIQNSVDLIILAVSCDAKILEEKAAIFTKFFLKEILQFKTFFNLSQENVNKIFELINEIKIPLTSQFANLSHTIS